MTPKDQKTETLGPASGEPLTALARFEKLEAPARYFEGGDAPAREVVLCFGARTLVLRTPGDVVLAHWPLGGLRALAGDGEDGLTIGPDLHGEERVTLHDPDMIAAIEAVSPDLRPAPQPAPPPRSHRGRWLLAGAVLLFALVAVLFPTLYRIAGEQVPVLREKELGEQLVERFAKEFNRPGVPLLRVCREPDATAALAQLQGRLGITANVRIRVVSAEGRNLVSFPGGETLIFRGLIEESDSPEALAAILAHEAVHHRRRDPLRQSVRAMGLWELGRLIFGKTLPDSMVRPAAAALRSATRDNAAENDALAATQSILTEVGLPMLLWDNLIDDVPGPPRVAAYLARRPVGSETTEAPTAPFDAALDDRSWLALGNICDRLQPF
ncbi:MAG: M48 family metalloprotease [Pseudomonadota bacterium]